LKYYEFLSFNKTAKLRESKLKIDTKVAKSSSRKAL
jgi:hypothetical protein